MRIVYFLFFCFSITCQAQVTVNVSSVRNVSCFGDRYGEIRVSASGGTAPYTYALNSGLFTSANVFSGLSAGSYIVTVKDANGQFSPSNVIALLEPLPLFSTLTQDGSNVTLMGQGGTLPYVYSMDGGVTYTSSNVFSILSPGTYQFQTMDSYGCFVSSSIIVASSLSVDSFDKTNVLNYSPNPVKDRLNISNSNAIDQIELFSTGGAAIFTKAINYNSTEVDMSSFSTGTYLLKIKVGDSQKTVKILKE